MFKRLLHNHEGIIVQACIATIIIVMGTVAWDVVILPASIFSDTIVSLGLPMPPQEHSIVNMNMVVAGLVEIVIVIGPLIWLYMSCFRKERQEYPYPY